MSRYTNIVSFDDAKAASRARRMQESAEDVRLRALSSGPIYYDLSKFAAPEPMPREGRRARAVQPDAEPPRAQERRLSRATRAARAEKAVHDERELDFDIEEYAPSARDEREQRRRERTKARADKMFARQFAADDVAGVDESGPRAALYEGQMGASQRRAARMQRASQAGPVSAKIDPAGWLSTLNIPARHLKAMTAALCLVLVVVFLYTPAQNYYQSVREHDRLAAECASIEERNAAIIAQNQSLASNAGMEDAVRQKYGYVVGGEETAVVTGLSEEATSDRGDGVEANVLASSVKAPEEWYTPYLDALFGVS